MGNFEKMLLNNLKRWNLSEKKPPLVVSFRITRGCDLRCKFCAPFKESDLKKELKINDYKKILQEAHNLGIQYCALVGGGEALYKKKLTLQIIDLTKKYNMVCWLVTNGFNFDEKSIVHLVNIGFDTVLFSIDGSHAKTHDYLRGVTGAFKKTTHSIQRFNYWKKRLGKVKPTLKVQTLILKNNYREIEQILKLIKRLKIQHYTINYFVPQFKEENKFLLNEKEEKGLTNILKKLIKQKYIKRMTNFEDYLKVKQIIKKRYNTNNKKDLLSAYCFQPWYHLNISEDGRINVCPEWNRGDRKKMSHESVKQIWFGRHFDGFRKKIINKEISGFCQNHCNFSVALENIRISNMIKHGLRAR